MHELYHHAATHHGVVSRIEAQSLGLTSKRVDRAVQRGVLRRAAPRVFVIAGAPSTWEQRCRVAALSAAGVVSHRSAARLHQLDGFSAGPVEVTVPKTRRPRGIDATIHRSTQFDLIDATSIDALPVTGLPRTVLDLGAVISTNRLDHVIDQVLRDRACTLQDLWTTLIIHSEHGRNGCGPLRLLLDRRTESDPIPDSAWNRMVGQLLEYRGLAPRYEYEIRTATGRFIGRTDLAFPTRRLAIELDSRRWHMTRNAFVNDPRRKNQLTLAGWTVLSFTWDDYKERPQDLVRTVIDALNPAA